MLKTRSNSIQRRVDNRHKSKNFVGISVDLRELSLDFEKIRLKKFEKSIKRKERAVNYLKPVVNELMNDLRKGSKLELSEIKSKFSLSKNRVKIIAQMLNQQCYFTSSDKNIPKKPSSILNKKQR
jgi:hypothetical protein